MKAAEAEILLLKRAVWAYFLLLIFEGALRKWFLPGLATPLLIIRDPIALWVVYKVWNMGELPKSFYLTGMVMIGLLGIVTAILFGHGSFPVAIYGARILMIHFPFMFAMGKIMDHDDVLKMGKALLLISIPMAVLIAAQFYSPQNAWVNRGVGGDLDGAGFSGAMGYFRPPGTFSFTNGNSYFFNVVALFVVYFWLNPKHVNKIILTGASVAVLMSIPLSISRSLLFSIIITVFFAAIGAAHNKKYASKMISTGIIVFIGLILLSQMEFFKTATAAFTDRFETANTNEGGLESVLADRYLGGLIGALKSASEQAFFGFGIGMGTNVGSKLLTGGTTFLISEGEWGRVIGEQGAIMGIGIILLRLGLCFKFLTHAYKRMLRSDLLPWILLSFALLIIPQGQWAQPTSLGFSTIIGGLLFASLRGQEPAVAKLPILIKEVEVNTGYIMEGAR
jgi:hypothetical protein